MLPNSFWNIPLVNLSHFRAGFPTGFYKFAIIWVSIIDWDFSNEIQLFHALTHSSSFKKTNRKSSPYIFVDWSAIIVHLKYWNELGSVAGPVIQANGRLTFEDDLTSGGLLYFTTQWTSVRTELADSMVNLGEPGGG